LLYLFFDQGNDNLPSKYISSVGVTEFDEQNLPTNTLDIYYHLLEIIGKRMNEYPDATITLVGTSDGKEMETKSERLALAERRAKAVKNYLVGKWGINPDRIKTETKDKPDLPTSEAYAEGYEENRRVEIYSDSPEILAPVIHSKFLEYSTNQEILQADIELNDKNITKWTLQLADYRNNEIYKKNGFGAPAEQITLPVNDILIEEAGRAIRNNNRIISSLTVENTQDKTETKKDDLNINLSKDQFEVGRLNLIVFDFDRYDISSLNKKLIVDFVRTSIKNNSIVKIRGGTDRLGERDYNKKLSRERANAVKNYLLSINPDINIVSVEGTGDEYLEYDNNLPEGRFYCRTVMIEIKTPIK
jgi:outer membrane protein OmpA-like peptidoglycan-associated protein